jgi:hypothetical protein
MQSEPKYKKYGWIWIVISPVLFLMAAISSVESIATYYIQLLCFSIIAALGFVSGICALFQKNWAYKVLKILSWTGFIYFSGAGVVMMAYGVPAILRSEFKTVAIIYAVAIGVVAIDLPFYLMARKLEAKENYSRAKRIIGQPGFLTPSPHNTLLAAPHRAFHLEW